MRSTAVDPARHRRVARGPGPGLAAAVGRQGFHGRGDVRKIQVTRARRPKATPLLVRARGTPRWRLIFSEAFEQDAVRPAPQGEGPPRTPNSARIG